MEKLIPGNDGLLGAQRTKPTVQQLPAFSRTGQLPPSLLKSNESLKALSAQSSALSALESTLDWNYSRLHTQLSELVTGNRVAPLQRSLRIHLTHKPIQQPWQQIGKELETPNFTTNEGVPRWELTINGHIVHDETKNEPKVVGNFTKFIKRIVIESDRDSTLYGGVTTINWIRPEATLPLGEEGLTLTLPSTTPTQLRISVYLDHTPERYTLRPEIAGLLDLTESDKAGATHAFWSYIKLNSLQDADNRSFRTDARMKKTFGNQEQVPFHHLPEYITRYLTPLVPVVFNQCMRVDENYAATSHCAFDLNIYVEDPIKADMERIRDELSAAGKSSVEISALDDMIAQNCQKVQTTHLKRNFLSAFSTSPIQFIDQFLASQSNELSTILETNGNSHSLSADAKIPISTPASTSIPGVSAGREGGDWTESIRKEEVWNNSWVEEGVSIFQSRLGEKALRMQVAQSQQLQAQAQQSAILAQQQAMQQQYQQHQQRAPPQQQPQQFAQPNQQYAQPPQQYAQPPQQYAPPPQQYAPPPQQYAQTPLYQQPLPNQYGRR